MSDTIELFGIETNNLKNIDVSLSKNSINLIIGPSGSGKSSLAYDTIAQIGQYELMSMFSDELREPTFKVKYYRNMLATVPIQQLNNNNNIRSTIGTYFGINRSIGLIFSVLLNMEEDFFVLNRADNLCPHCHGLGYIKQLDVNRIIDYDAPLEKCPIKCWIRYKDFYCKIITQFCIDKGIDYKKNFRTLSDEEKEIILFGKSDRKYSIRFKKNNTYSNRTTRYLGIMTGESMMPNFHPSKQFFADKVCLLCNGQKFSQKHMGFKVSNLSIGEFMCMPFDALLKWMETTNLQATNTALALPFNAIQRFVKKAVELDLGHLFFHRSIPTLSGGELQRLRLIQVFNTQLSDLLIVLDEPLAGLSGSEMSIIYEDILMLSKRHTMLIVDHHDTFVSSSRVIIALGEKSGMNGGNIIDTNKYLSSQKQELPYNPKLVNNIISISIINKVYDYSGVDIDIAENRLNIILGSSGIGKSTLLREYLPQYFEHYAYINQKSLLGNKNSSVATTLNIFGQIIEGLAKKYGKDKHFFSNLTGCEGACPICLGAGYLNFGSDFRNQIRIECSECSGTGFNKKLSNYKYCDKSIIDIWHMTIDEAYEFYHENKNKISNILKEASLLLLGHLKIGQPTSLLSGGENIRIKILKSANSSSSILGIDEPFRGLSHSEIHTMILYFDKLIAKGKTIIVAEHDEYSLRYFSKRILLTNEKGILIGINQD